MKKLFLIITVLTMLLLASCSNVGNIIGGNGSGNGGVQNGSGEGQDNNTSGKPLIWDLKTDVYLVSDVKGADRQDISDNFTERTGNTLKPHSDTKAQMEHELVIGLSTRPISQAAYHLLDRNLSDDEDPEGYVILVQDGSVAVAYTSEASYSEAMDAFYTHCGFSEYYAENGPVFWDFYSLSARAEQNRDKMYDEGFAKLEAALIADGANDASTIVRELRNYYGLFKTEQLYWLADLYDPDLGAFYFSNSGRDNLGFLPDLESTSQAFTMLDRSGLFSVIGGITSSASTGTLPEFVTEPLVNWARSLQSSEDGYFYHPQWGAAIGASRLGRDLDNAVSIFKMTRSNPYYNDPSGRMRGIYGAYGDNAVKPAAHLSSKLSGTAATAVSAIIPAALAGGPQQYLGSLDQWKNYVDNLNINDSGVSYGMGNTLVSLWSVIKAAGPEYVDYLFDYLDSHMYADIGLWEYQNQDDYDNSDNVGYNGTNGLMKLCVLYGSLGRAVPNAYQALQSTIKVGLYPNTDPKDETVCYVLNIWTCLGSMIKNIKTNDPDNYPAAKKLLVDNMAGLINASYDLQKTHLMEDGGFSYYERREGRTSQGAPVACARTAESDINATMVATSSTIGALFGTMKAAFAGVEEIPIWGDDDYYVFMNELENAGKVYKNAIPQAETITFNDYVEADIVDGTEKQPDDDVFLTINTSYFNSNVVKRPGTVAADADLALRMESFVETAYDPAKGMDMPLKDENGKEIMASGPANAYVNIGNAMGVGDCYTLSTDILFEEADIGSVLQIFVLDSKLGSSYYLTGFQFNTYTKDGETYIRFMDMYKGLDGSQNQNIYEKLKVGDWFNIRLEIYKIYTENEDETKTLDLCTKIYINDKYITSSDGSYQLKDGTVNDIEPDQIMFSQYRYRGSVLYFDNILTERKEKEFAREIIHNEVTFDDGTILCSPSITVNVGTAETGLPNDTVVEGETEGGNDRNYYKIRTDVEGKVGDAVLEVYHKAGQRYSGYGTSNVGVGITDGSVSGQIYVLEFDMMVNKVEEYSEAINYFARIRIGTATSAGLWQDFTASGNDIFCRINSAANGQIKLGEFGEWFHVKMIWNVINPSNINLTDPDAHTVEYYLLTYDSEGNETLADYRSLYSSYVASNKPLDNIFFCGSENGYGFDQQYFLDNITYIRTTDKSILPEVITE